MKDGRNHRPQRARLFRFRRLHAAVELRGGQMRGPYSRALHHPQRSRRRLLRLYQSYSCDGHARLWRHCARLCARVPNGQGRHSDRHRPARIPHSQRLSRRRHESASPRGEELRAHRMRASDRRKSQLAAARRIPAHVVAAGRRGGAHAAAPTARAHRRSAPAVAPPPTAPQRVAYERPAPAATARTVPPAPPPRSAPPPAPSPAGSTHGAPRFSSVFGTRRR